MSDAEQKDESKQTNVIMTKPKENMQYTRRIRRHLPPEPIQPIRVGMNPKKPPRQDPLAGIIVPPPIRAIIYRNCRGKNAEEVIKILKQLMKFSQDAMRANRNLALELLWLVIQKGNDYY